MSAANPLTCERCNQAPAVIHLTTIADGLTVVRHYCITCARALGASVTTVAADDPPQSER